MEVNFTFTVALVQTEEKGDFFASIFANPVLNGLALAIHIFGYIGVFGFITVIWYEVSGLAGPYRTMVNRLISFEFGILVVYYTWAIGLNILRIFVGPIPTIICQFNVFIKNFSAMAISMTIVAFTGLHFIFICIYKSIPSIDDNFLTIFIIALLSLMSTLGTLTFFYLPGKPVLNQVTLILILNKNSNYFFFLFVADLHWCIL